MYKEHLCFTIHAQAPNAARKAVVIELEFYLCTVLNKCLQNGAKLTNINFAFNPAGNHANSLLR